MLPARYGLTGPALDPKKYTQSGSWEIGDMVWLKIYDKRLSLIQGMCTAEKLVLAGTHLELRDGLKKNKCLLLRHALFSVSGTSCSQR
jgi:hypothetical protein